MNPISRFTKKLSILFHRDGFRRGLDEEMEFQAIRAGSSGCVSNASDLDTLLKAIGVIGRGEIWVSRRVASRLWNGALPKRPKEELVRELYRAENESQPEPSGSQDMIGLIYPGVNRLDYDASCEGGIFPAHIESNCDPEIARWLERVLQLVAVNQRPVGYNPLGIKNLDPEWIRRLGQSGKDCYAAILGRNVQALADSMNLCMDCWEAILPHTVRHPTLNIDLKAILANFQARYPGAMYSGCGGGYLMVVAEEDVPGAFRVRIRTE